MNAVASALPLSGATELVGDDSPATWTREVFQRAVEPLLPRMYRMCIALCHDASQAQDLLQNSLIKAYLARGQFEGRSGLAGWLFGIVRHEHADFVRTNARRRGLMSRALEQCTLVVEDMVSAAPPDPETWIGLSEESGVLLECLRAIPEPYRMVVLLCDVEELSHEEIASTLGIAIGTVKSRHARGLSRLRSAYERRAPVTQATQATHVRGNT